MKATLRNQLIEKIKQLPEDRIREVLSFVDLIQTETSFKNANSIKADKAQIIATIEATNSFGIYYGDPQEIHALEYGKPIVWEKRQVCSISKRKLVKYLTELISIAKRVTCDVETETQIPGVEGQHAWVNIFVPDELADQIDELVVQRAHDIFIATGYDIGVMVYEKSQLKNAALEKE